MAAIQSRLDEIPEPSTIKGRFVITVFVDDVDKAKEEIHALLSTWTWAVAVYIEFFEEKEEADAE